MEPTFVPLPEKLPIHVHITTGIFAVVALPTLVGNILLLFIVCRSSVFGDLSTLLVTFISLADVLYVLYISGYIIVQYLHLTLPSSVCTLAIYLQALLRMAPSCTFVLVGLNWYFASFSPAFCYKFHQITFIGLKCFIGTWLMALLLNLGIPFVVCDNYEEAPFLGYSAFIAIVGYLAPVVIEIVLHVKNLCKTKRELEHPYNSKVLLSYNLKIIKVFLLLSVMFFLSTAPLLVHPFLSKLGMVSSGYAVFLYHLLSCIPCLLNPICQYLISQKFQDEVSSLLCRKTVEQRSKEDIPEAGRKVIAPEAFSVNKGIYEPRTPSWRQGPEYWERDLIFGEYPSMMDPGIKTYGGSLRKNDEDGDTFNADDKIGDLATIFSPRASAEKATRTGSKKGIKPKVNAVKSGNTSSHEQNLPRETAANTWPRKEPTAERRGIATFTRPVINSDVPTEPLPNVVRFNRNLVGRSASLYDPIRKSVASQEPVTRTSSADNIGMVKKVTKTKKKNKHVHWSVSEKETVMDTYL